MHQFKLLYTEIHLGAKSQPASNSEALTNNTCDRQGAQKQYLKKRDLSIAKNSI
jgi:hypothetical protein